MKMNSVWFLSSQSQRPVWGADAQHECSTLWLVVREAWGQGFRKPGGRVFSAAQGPQGKFATGQYA